MSEPIIELITVNIQEAVNTIKTANNFFQDLTVERPKKINFLDQAWGNGTVLLVQGVSEKLTETSGCITWRQHYSLMIVIDDSNKSTTPIDTHENRARSDVEKKLCEDIRRGGNAINTGILEPDKFATEDGSNAGITVNCYVDYRTKENDPYSAA